MLENSLTGVSIDVPPSTRKMFNFKELVFTWWSTLRASVMGFFIGVLPGAGASVASAVTYAYEKKHYENRDPTQNSDAAICEGWLLQRPRTTARQQDRSFPC